jgi:hypothetical protein
LNCGVQCMASLMNGLPSSDNLDLLLLIEFLAPL